MSPRSSSSVTRALRLSVGLAVAVAVALSLAACKGGGDDSVDAGPKVRAYDLVARRVPGTDLVVFLPKGWLLDMPDPGPLPPAPPAGAPLALNTRTLLVARPGSPAPGMLVTPKLMVLEDPWLPVGTSAIDYLVAQRTSNQTALGTQIQHVQAEPSRRQGRPSYFVRDEWTVDVPGAPPRALAQEALLLLDAVTTKDGRPGLHGYTVVLMMEQPELEQSLGLVRALFADIRFEGRDAVDAGPR